MLIAARNSQDFACCLRAIVRMDNSKSTATLGICPRKRDRRRGQLRDSHANLTCSENGEDYVFLTNSWHQPLRLISPWTTLHAFGGWKSMQLSQRWSPFGVS